MGCAFPYDSCVAYDLHQCRNSTVPEMTSDNLISDVNATKMSIYNNGMVTKLTVLSPHHQQVQTIVSLSSCQTPDSPMFWPVVGTRHFAYFAVELMDVTKQRGITVRKLKLCTPTVMGVDKRAVRQVSK